MKLETKQASWSLPILSVELILSRSEAHELCPGFDAKTHTSSSYLSQHEKDLLEREKPRLLQSLKQTLQLSIAVE